MTTSPTVHTQSSDSSPDSSAGSSAGSSAHPGRVPLRLRLVDGLESGHLDGAWWPQSRDLQSEFADLVDHFPVLAGRIQRLLFSRPDWDAAPEGGASARRVHAARGPVKVDSFPSDDTHLIVLKMGSGRRLRLLVVPSDTEPDRARQTMDQAVDSDNTENPKQLLGLDGQDQGGIGVHVWDDDHAGAS
jgi:Family of unknown function (DUF5994)